MTGEEARNGEHRADAHFVRLATGDRKAAEGAERRETALGGFLRFHQHERRAAIRKLRCVASGDVLAFLDLLAALEHRRKFLQVGQRRLRTVAIVARHFAVLHCDFARLLVGDSHLGLHRDDLVLVETSGLRGGRALLGLKGVLVLVFA